jgi:hypothetical protein
VNFQLVAAMNLYLCGHLGYPQKACGCAPAIVTRYQKRISGPLLDRIDIHVEVPRIDYEKLGSDHLGESSASIRERVQAARGRQQVRFAGPDIVCPVWEPGLSPRAGSGTIAIRTCAWRRSGNSASWTKRRIAWCGWRHRAVHEPVEPVRAGVSPSIEAGAHDCGSGGE